MKFFNIKNSVDDFKFSYGFGEKAKAAAKVLGIAAVNTAIFAGKAVSTVSTAVEKEQQRLKKQQDK